MKSAIAVLPGAIRPMSPEAINNVRRLEDHSLAHLQQMKAVTHHLIHGGMYHRTMMVPKGATLTGALIKRATTLVVSGNAIVYVGDDAADSLHLSGYNVIAASANRKQAFLAIEDTYLTMSFPTKARTVEEAESEFTDEHERLMSRHNENIVVITEDRS